MKKSSAIQVRKSTRSSAIATTQGQGASRLPASKRPTLLGHDLDTELAYGFTKAERGNHTHVIGSTGTGKSKFLELMLRQDIENRNCGVCLLDPHGKLYEDILSYVATEKTSLASRIVTFNPFNDLENIMGFNPIPADKDRLDYIEKTFVSACLKAWGQDDIHETPRIARWLQIIVHTLLVNDMTLLESAPLISSEKDNQIREQMIMNVINDSVRVEWEQFIASSLRDRKNIIEGAGNRLSDFLQNEIIRLIIGQRENALDLAKIMKEGKILLINLHDEHGRVTHTDSTLLGTMLVSELHRLIKRRDHRDPKLKPFYVYIDEFAQYVTKDIGRSLEEVRKFKASFVLAHQHLTQLKREDEYLYASVMTNCKNKVVFGGLSEEDSDLMTKEIQTGFIDLKAIKHRQMRIRERHIETVRTVVAKQKGEARGSSTQTNESHTRSITDTLGKSLGTSESETRTQSRQKGQSQSTSHGETRGSSQGRTDTEGVSDSIGESYGKTLGQSHTDGQSESLSFNRSHSSGGSRGVSEGTTEGKSKARALGRTRTDSSSQSQADNWNSGNTVGSSDSFSDGSSTSSNSSTAHGSVSLDHGVGTHSYSRNSMDGYGSSHSQVSSRSNNSSQSDSWGGSSSHSSSLAHGQSRTDTQSVSLSENRTNNRSTNFSDSKGSSESWTKNSADSRSQAETTGNNSSRTTSKSGSNSSSETQSSTTTQTQGTNESEGLSLGESRGTSSTESEAQSTGSSDTRGSSQGTSHSYTESTSTSDVPFLEPVEVEEEASLQFWTREDMMYMKKAQMKNLPVAQAFVKIASHPPVHCQIAHMPESRYSAKLQSDMIKRLNRKIVAKNSDMYLTLSDAQESIFERQDQRFGEIIRFYDTLSSKQTDESPVDDTVVDDGDEGVFGD